jgi:hypothetical protein
VRDAGENLEEDVEWVTGEGINDKDTSEAKDEAPRTRKTAAHTSLDSPLLNSKCKSGICVGSSEIFVG